jgi:hypothetical protein
MPQVDHDPNMRLRYLMAEPVQDRRNHPALVPAGSYPLLVGVDGRYAGSFRRFPGFYGVFDLRDVDVDAAGDADSITAVWFFKYVAVQVAVGLDSNDQPIGDATARTLRGFVVAHNYKDSTDSDAVKGVLRFVYRDPADNSSWFSQTLLQEISFKSDRRIIIDSDLSNANVINATAEIDAASMGPFLYFVVNRGTPLGIAIDWTNGAAPRDYYRRSVRVSSTGATSLQWDFTDLGPLQQPVQNFPTEVGQDIDPPSIVATGGKLGGTIKSAIRTYSGFKNVQGPLIGIATTDTDDTGTPTSRVRYQSDRAPDQPGFPHLSNLGVDDDNLKPKIRVYRTVDSLSFTAITGLGVTGGKLFREAEIPIINDGSSNLDGATSAAEYHTSNRGFNVFAGDIDDNSLVVQPWINPFTSDTALTSRKLKLLLPYQGTLLRIGSVPLAAPPAVNVERDEVLSWGSLERYAPEEFRIQDSTPLGSKQDERVLALIGTGDYAFAVGDSSVFRIHRNGGVLGITEVQSLAGGVGRYAAIGVGAELYYVNPVGLYVVNGATGEFQIVAALSRVILEDWKDSLDSVRMCFDMRLGALCILNATEEECILIWASTGMVTTLRDTVFQFCTEGINPEDVGYSRSYWITALGAVYTPNAERGMDKALAMCGFSGTGGFTPVWNTTIATAALGTTTASTLWVLGHVDDSVVGFKVYVTSGDRAFESAKVSAVNRTTVSGTDVTELTLASALTGVPAEDDKVSVSPVLFEVVGWPIQELEEQIDLFRSKAVKSMGHNIILLGGNTTTAGNPNLEMVHRLYRRGDLNTPLPYSYRAAMNADPSKNYSYFGGVEGPILFPAWAQYASNLDFELLGTIVHGMMKMTEAESSPV